LNHKFVGLLLVFTIATTLWPWIFLSVVLMSKGIEMEHHTQAQKHPQESAFFVASIAGVVYIMTVCQFQTAVAILARKESIFPNVNGIDHRIFFIALKARSYSTFLFDQRRYGLVFIAIMFAVPFTFVTSGITALLLPIRFTRAASVVATELDFTSNQTDCINWFNNNTISSNCGWKVSFGSFCIETTHFNPLLHRHTRVGATRTALTRIKCWTHYKQAALMCVARNSY
jgi:MFS family permease